MVVGKKYINKVDAVNLKNGKSSTVSYQFKIPIREYEKAMGIRDFRSIRFMRMFLHDLRKKPNCVSVHYIVRGDWRVYNKELYIAKSSDFRR